MATTYQLYTRHLFRGDLEWNAETAYKRHCRNVEEVLWRDSSVEDGW